jgi:hypothetical protein
VCVNFGLGPIGLGLGPLSCDIGLGLFWALLGYWVCGLGLALHFLLLGLWAWAWVAVGPRPTASMQTTYIRCAAQHCLE